jgi:hypothetical protein
MLVQPGTDMQTATLPLLALASGLFLCGCKHFEYRIVQPANAAQTIGKQTITVPYDPLEYRFTRPDDYISMRVANPTDDPITLLSAKSYILDPEGETHPLQNRTIAPHSYVRMTLPPTARVYSPSYAGGLGLGFGYGFHDPLLFNGRFGYPYYYPYYGLSDPFYYAPPVYVQQITPYDWEWKQGEVHLKLEYERAGKNFVHNLVFERRRVK